MLRILDNAMIQAVRFVTVEKGYDPRQFALVGLGGGGPLHVVALARQLRMSRAIVPVNPGVLSAWGMLTVDMVQDRSRTVLKRRQAIDNVELGNVLAELKNEITVAFQRQGAEAERIAWEYVLDLQYYGQVFALAVPLAGSPITDVPGGDAAVRLAEEGVFSVPIELGPDGTVTDELLQGAIERFHVEHEREYGHSDREQEVQIVHARVFGRVAVPKPELIREPASDPDATGAVVERRRAVFGGEAFEVDVFDRLLLQAGNRIDGPALIDETTSTTVLPPGSSAVVDAYGNLLIDTGV
jgi:N-methylhydantoinase A